MKTSINLGELSKREFAIIYDISDYLETIYGLSEEERNQYIADFFLLDKGHFLKSQ